ncbi:unnamed protein product [Trifolium pratense]|uniref:Uncharacterized protein n=1 Tax=Trifolium pratense TaxID=57577 RepID=A0ACB0LYZ0_TRIPR|nr:unnamed protein product [Trifolium pratense]
MHQCHSSLIPPRSFTNKKVTQLLKVFQFTDFQWHRLQASASNIQMDSGNLVISVSDTSRERRCFSSPIESAEGFVDARGYVAALALGAQGVCSFANPLYKRKVIKLDETEYTDVFGRARWPGAPHRVLKTPFFKEWRSLPTHESEANKPFIGHSTIRGVFLSFRRAGFQKANMKQV